MSLAAVATVTKRYSLWLMDPRKTGSLVSFLPVLAYDGANMTQIDAGGILDMAVAGTSATLLARKWESALLVNVVTTRCAAS